MWSVVTRHKEWENIVNGNLSDRWHSCLDYANSVLHGTTNLPRKHFYTVSQKRPTFGLLKHRHMCTDFYIYFLAEMLPMK